VGKTYPAFFVEDIISDIFYLDLARVDGWGNFVYNQESNGICFEL
jgi:hypothetical protein